MAMTVIRGRMEIRRAAFLLGVAGVVWCLVQGFSAVYTSAGWNYEYVGNSDFWLQFGRSMLNFVMGLIAYTTIHFTIRDTYEVRKNTVHRSLASIIVLASALWVFTGDMLVLMGR